MHILAKESSYDFQSMATAGLVDIRLNQVSFLIRALREVFFGEAKLWELRQYQQVEISKSTSRKI